MAEGDPQRTQNWEKERKAERFRTEQDPLRILVDGEEVSLAEAERRGREPDLPPEEEREDAVTVTSEDGLRIIKEVALGIKRREKTKELREFRRKIEEESAEIAARGMVIDLPAEQEV